MISESLYEAYYNYKMKPSYKFIAYDLYTQLYLDEQTNKFCESDIKHAKQFDLPMNKDESYLSIFLHNDRDAIIHANDNLKLCFIVINPITFEQIKQIDI